MKTRELEEHMKELDGLPERTIDQCADAKSPELGTLDMIERVVALLREARDGGWEIALMQHGDFKGRDRFELTVWRDPPLVDAPEEASPRQVDGQVPGMNT